MKNVRLPLEEFTTLPQDAMDMIACMKLSMVGLSAFRTFKPSETSGGMQKAGRHRTCDGARSTNFISG